MAEEAPLHLTHIAYDANIPGYWYIRFSGDMRRWREMKEQLKHIARQYGILAGYTYKWDSSYEWDARCKGSWYIHRSVVESILNAFDNRAEATVLFQGKVEQAAIYFEARRKARLEEQLRLREQQAERDAEQRRHDAEAKQKLNDLLNSFLQDTPPPEVVTALQILRLGKDCSQEDAKSAYRVLAKRYHTDNGGNHARIVEINNARDVLFLWKGWKKRQAI